MVFKKILTISKKGFKKRSIRFKRKINEIDAHIIDKWSEMTLELKKAILSQYLNTLKKNEKKKLIKSLKDKFELISEDTEAESLLASENEVLFDYLWSKIPPEEKQSLFESGIGDCVLVGIHGSEEEFHLTQVLSPGKYKNKK